MTTPFHIVADAQIPGVTRISRSAAFPRPHVAITGALHGNELCGLRAHDALVERARSGTLALGEGTLILIHGNLEATRLGVRYTPDGYDINRIFNLKFRETLDESEWGYEHHRALELTPLLDDVDGAIDIHSATAPTVPFAVALPGSLEIAKQIGVQWVTHGWDDVSDIADGVALARVASRRKPAVAVECGQHGESTTTEVALAVIARFMKALGMWSAPVDPGFECRVLQVFAALPKPSDEFRFVKPIRGFEELSEGQLLGKDDAGEMRSPGKGFALLPNDGVPLYKNVVYIARNHP